MKLKITSILKYVTENDKCPFNEWFDLKDHVTKAIVTNRLDRLVQGNWGTCKKINQNLWELKIDFGSGIRIYFILKNKEEILLLCGGDKSTQERDIKKAKKYWMNYQE